MFVERVCSVVVRRAPVRRARRRPPVPKRWDARLRKLLATCWSLSHEKRPDFRELVPQLIALRDAEAAAEDKRTKWQLLRRAVYP